MSKWQTGNPLPFLYRKLSPEKINQYARVSGDMNPIHLDKDFALQTPYKGVVAHGMLLLAYIGEMLTIAFGVSWLTKGSLSVRFKHPAYANDSITIGGNVESITHSSTICQLICQVYCRNQNQDILVTGQAKVEILRED